MAGRFRFAPRVCRVHAEWYSQREEQGPGDGGAGGSWRKGDRLEEDKHNKLARHTDMKERKDKQCGTQNSSPGGGAHRTSD
eukprot:scaffold6290_cov125-Isochrysis_galbana.AAC.5